MAFQIVKPTAAKEGFHGILYGDPGTGKTSSFDDPNFKVLLLDIELSSAVLADAPNVDLVKIDDELDPNGKIVEYAYDKFIEVGKAIDRGEVQGYDLIVIDSFTRFQDHMKTWIAEKSAPNRKRGPSGKFGDACIQDWGQLADLMARTIKWVHSWTKRGDNSVHVMWIAHSIEEKDEMTKQLVKTKIALQGSNTPDVVMSVVDGFFYMYNRDKVDEKGKFIGTERGILTQSAGGFKSKARQSTRRDPLPARIVNPVWSEIFHSLGYDRK